VYILIDIKRENKEDKQKMVGIMRLLDPFLFAELVVVAILVPLYICFSLRLVRKKKDSPGNTCVLKFGIIYFICSIASAIFIEFIVYRLISMFIPLATGLPFTVKVRPVDISGKTTPSGFYRYNPSMLSINNNSYHLISLREGSYKNCPSNFINLNVRSANRLHIALGATREGPFKYSHTFERKDINPLTPHQGFEDGRLFYLGTEVNDSETITHVGLTLASHVWMYVTDFKVRVSENGEAILSDVKEPVPVHVEGTHPETKQKNWMYIPPANPSDASVQDPLFVQWLNPMTVVSVNMTSGNAKIVHESFYIPCISGQLHGNTNFLRHPTDPRKLIGIAHLRVDNSVVISNPYYSNVVVEIEQHLNNSFVMTGISEYFRLPYDEDSQASHHIHFPMTMEYTDSSKQEIDVFMGDMDCTAHAASIKTDDLLSLIKPVKC